MATPQCQELWPTDTRERAWVAWIPQVGGTVVVRHMAVLAPGEDLTEYPETWELTWAEWERDHATAYGLTLDGQAIAALTERRAAWRKLRQMANGDATYDEATMRAVLGALRRILSDITEEVPDA